jgi:hypothetical protein
MMKIYFSSPRWTPYFQRACSQCRTEAVSLVFWAEFGVVPEAATYRHGERVNGELRGCQREEMRFTSPLDIFEVPEEVAGSENAVSTSCSRSEVEMAAGESQVGVPNYFLR